MKYLIASDIHGSAKYCEALLQAYEREKADRLVLLGDILYHGPRNDLPEGYAPKKVIELLNAMKDRILCVRGNCDTEVDQMVLDFPVLADYAILDLGSRLVYATHGHVYNTSKLPPLGKDDILLHGHTHIPACTGESGVLYLNPGSVSIPKEKSPHSYMTLENGLFLWKTLEGEEYKRFNAENGNSNPLIAGKTASGSTGAVTPVRCRDCKYFATDCSMGNCCTYCNLHSAEPVVYVNGNDYCSRGEK